MPPGKDRLYVALYARGGAATMPGGEDKYHWGLIVGPKDEKKDGRGTRLHVKERVVGPGQMQWEFEERDIPLAATQMILVRILVGKVTNMALLLQTIRSEPVKQGDEQWNCVIWVKDVLQALRTKNVFSSSQLEWKVVRDTSMKYCQDKTDQHRFDGAGTFNMSKVPTFDLIEKCETVP